MPPEQRVAAFHKRNASMNDNIAEGVEYSSYAKLPKHRLATTVMQDRIKPSSSPRAVFNETNDYVTGFTS